MKVDITIREADPAQSREIMALVSHLMGSTAAPSATMAFAPGPNVATTNAAPADDDNGPVQTVAPGEVDSEGMPWDERIHAGTKGKTEGGKWRQRRGVQPGIVQNVETELRAKGYGTPPGAPTPPMPPGMTAPIPVAPAPIPAPIPVAQPIPVAAPMPAPIPVVAAPAPAPVPAAAPLSNPPPPDPTRVLSFDALMGFIQTALTSNMIDGEYVASLASRMSLTAITDIAADPVRCYQVYAMMYFDKRVPQ